MSVEELIKKVQEANETRTAEERKKLLIRAHILDSDGNYDSRYFREETIQKSKLQTVVS